ncbi:hypothetical protein [Sphingomonas kyeonggiensis]|uniref:Uncharacterized protein n=1 Tax=Sphingomonas kyeonggiensis TaxID=1268553 RepID=A0A7W6JUE9_9SPHN|nr:hypothetical protein [Sphingomonas kyeonggiensis]MBB4098701.1 hypothetical protein [Sphingomonas kyeonggiensis]
MRSLSILAIAVLLPLPAVAQTSSEVRPFDVTGQVPGTCTLGAPRLGGAQANFRGINGNSLPIDQLVDGTTLSTRPASAEISFDAVCAFPHLLRVESQNNGLWRTGERSGVAPEGFGDAVPYRATLLWASQTLALFADARLRRMSEGTLYVGATATGTLQLNLVIDAGATNHRANAPLVAGTYGDTLRITLEPQQ